MDERTLSTDTVDKTPDCTRVRRHQNTGVPGSYTSDKVYDLVPRDAIKGKIHIVRFDEVFRFFSAHVKRKKRISSLTNTGSNWASELFYVNRFYYNHSKTYEYIEKL